MDSNEVISKNPNHDDVIKWKNFPRYWLFVRGIHRSSVNSPHKGQWRGALMFSAPAPAPLPKIKAWVNNREACDLRRHRSHYDGTVMYTKVLLHQPIQALVITYDEPFTYFNPVIICHAPACHLFNKKSYSESKVTNLQPFNCTFIKMYPGANGLYNQLYWRGIWIYSQWQCVNSLHFCLYNRNPNTWKFLSMLWVQVSPAQQTLHWRCKLSTLMYHQVISNHKFERIYFNAKIFCLLLPCIHVTPGHQQSWH